MACTVLLNGTVNIISADKGAEIAEKLKYAGYNQLMCEGNGMIYGGEYATHA